MNFSASRKLNSVNTRPIKILAYISLFLVLKNRDEEKGGQAEVFLLLSVELKKGAQGNQDHNTCRKKSAEDCGAGYKSC